MYLMFNSQMEIPQGTRQFMALEILMSKYMHFNSKVKQASGEEGVDFVKESNNLRNSVAEWDFHSNALHDIEPFFWMLLWCLFYRRPKNPSNSYTPEQLQRQLDTGNQIFVDGSKQKHGQPSALRCQCLSDRHLDRAATEGDESHCSKDVDAGLVWKKADVLQS